MVHVVSLIRSHHVSKIMCARKIILGPIMTTLRLTNQDMYYIVDAETKNAFVVKDEAILNNTFVVPHNIKLLKKYGAHINVEWCNRTSAVKYLFKYIPKGVDRATYVIEKGNTTTTFDTTTSDESNERVIKQRNEIQVYVDARYLSACESMFRTFAFHI